MYLVAESEGCRFLSQVFLGSPFASQNNLERGNSGSSVSDCFEQKIQIFYGIKPSNTSDENHAFRNSKSFSNPLTQLCSHIQRLHWCSIANHNGFSLRDSNLLDHLPAQGRRNTNDCSTHASQKILFPKMPDRSIETPTMHCEDDPIQSGKPGADSAIEPAQLVMAMKNVNVLL